MSYSQVGGLIKIKKVETSEEFYELKDDWNRLLSESNADCFFLRWEWLWSWWKIYGENYNLCVLLVYKDNVLSGIGPFYLQEKPLFKVFVVKTLRFLGTNEKALMSEYMNIISSYGEEESVTRAVVEFIENTNLCDQMLLQHIDTSSKTPDLLKKLSGELRFYFLGFREFESPFLKLPESYEAFARNLSGSLRSSIKRGHKKLVKYGAVSFRKTDDLSELETDYSELVRLHQKRWEARNFPGSFSGRFVLFQEMVMKDMLKNGHLELMFLSVDGKNIAAQYNIKYKNKIYFFQAGLDVTFDNNISTGILLHDYCINAAISRGLKEYDFLLMGKTDSYKKRLASDSRYMRDVYIARPGLAAAITRIRDKAKSYFHAVNGLRHKVTEISE